jgi:hypothetical protein
MTKFSLHNYFSIGPTRIDLDQLGQPFNWVQSGPLGNSRVHLDAFCHLILWISLYFKFIIAQINTTYSGEIGEGR